jgi:gas vesicle protein
MNKDCLVGFSVGLGVGVGLALLLAPQSGEDTQAMIAGQAKKGKEYVKEQVSDLRDSASDLVDRGTDLVNKGKEQVARHRQNLEQALEAGKQAYKEKVG